MMQFADQARIILISQLMKGISIFLQSIYFNYFNDTAISAFKISSSLILVKNLDLNLNELESVIGSSGSPSQYCHKLPVVPD